MTEPNEQDVAAIVRNAGHEIPAAYRTELRAALEHAWRGEEPSASIARVVTIEPRRARRTLAWMTLATAAAAAAVVVGLWMVNGKHPLVTTDTPILTQLTIDRTPKSTTTSTTTPRVDPSQVIDLDAGAAFDVSPGEQVVVDEVLANIEARDGPVDHDTGWYVVPPNTSPDGVDDCLAGTYRVLWWGDLAMQFWRYEAGTEHLLNWTLGDRAAVDWFAGSEPSRPADPKPTGFTVTGGLGIGSPEADIATAFGDRLAKGEPAFAAPDALSYRASNGDPNWPDLPAGVSSQVAVVVRDGRVVGVNATMLFC